MEDKHPGFTTDEAYKLIDDITSFAQPVVVLTGGEPLLRDDIFDIALYGHKKGLRMCLATNGTLVTEEICSHIKESGIKIVSLSLDGSRSEVHDDFRKQEGAFEASIQAARLFKKHGIEFIINSSFTQRNKDEIESIYKLAKKLGATAWYLFMIVPTGRGEDIMDELITGQEYEEILNWHYDMEKCEDDMLVRPTCAPHYYRIVLQRSKEEGETFKRRNLKFSTGGAKGCLAGQLIALIDVEGNVLPCSYFPKAAGNVRQKSFKDIWENSELFHHLRDFKSYRGKCGSCEFINVCGGCRARADTVYGDYLEEEPFCSYIPKKLVHKG
jgi:radical SAM protein with 4Fe4S-binding SPASM domain